MHNVLLMLSTSQPPDPREELAWHCKRCQEYGETYFVTTRRILDADAVAFYGNIELDYRYLGKGCFVEYVPLISPEGKRVIELIRSDENHIYHNVDSAGKLHIPDTARGFIRLRHITLANGSQDIESLHGRISGTGKTAGSPLTVENVLRRGSACVEVHFTSSEPLCQVCR